MLFTALAMAASFAVANIFSVLMVQSEARNRAVLAGTFEAAFALFWIEASHYSLNSLNAHESATTQLLMLGALLIGNFTGGYIGTKVGHRLVRNHVEEQMDERLAEAEAAMLIAEEALEELTHEIAVHHEHDEHDEHESRDHQ